MKSLKDFIASQLAVGRTFFTKQDALQVLGITPSQFKFQAYRLSQKRLLKRLATDFYMIVPPEYYNLGSLPPIQFIDSLMKHLKQEYYVGLLSASSLYGATHQQPMSFQVITNKQVRRIILERGAIEFHVYKGCESAIKKTFTVATGYVQASSKEQTMIDLMRFYQASGHMSNAALVVKTLAEECDLKALEQVVKNEKINSVLQRLGYVFEFTGLSNLAAIVSRELQTRNLRYVLLRPDFHNKQGKKSTIWRLIVNNTLEIE